MMEDIGIKTGESLPPVKVSYKSTVPKHGYRYHPKPENDFNPLIDWPVNEECFCGSHRKFKKCHRNKIEHGVPKKLAAELKVFMKKFTDGFPMPELKIDPVMLLEEFRPADRKSIKTVNDLLKPSLKKVDAPVSACGDVGGDIAGNTDSIPIGSV